MKNTDEFQINGREKQKQRIKKYETLMRDAQRFMNERNLSAESYAALSSIINQLKNYYESNEWKQDYADDEAGLLPPDLERGVLSEDGLYNLLEEYQNLHWQEGYMIRFRITGNSAVLSANREGLLSLANHLINLSNAPAGNHIHLDQYNSLEDGSDELIIERYK